MEPLECDRCGNCVFVEKNSWQHTAIQWTSWSEEACAEFREDTRPRKAGIHFNSCSALREAIHRASVEGRIPVPD
ncbi:hypothetical protein [Rhodococcus daqingensis]|uniref:Ferredoxin n=1 Tax=Rhodococcus daqingensis TaxID=2479363 RepID=A0ABW2RSH3_9NOCA